MSHLLWHWVPPEYSWPILLAKVGDELETHCRHALELSGKVPAPGVLALDIMEDLEAAGTVRVDCGRVDAVVTL